MKLTIVNTTVQIRRQYQACSAFQWARELMMNSMEAKATRIEFGIDWQGVEKLGVYRRTIANDAPGMSKKELVEYFSKLNLGGKKIGGAHDNFGLGAKITTLPWNEEGVVIISVKNGVKSMIWIRFDSTSGEFELVDWDDDGVMTAVINPDEWDWPEDDVDWSKVGPKWFKGDGTVTLLLGNKSSPDTMMGDPEKGEGKGFRQLTCYLNNRFWTVGKVKIQVMELPSNRSKWPRGEKEFSQGGRDADARNRGVKGARYFWKDYPAQTGKRKGKLTASGSVSLLGGNVAAHWLLWEGDRPDMAPGHPENGFFATKYGDELYERGQHGAHFRWFGITEKSVQKNVCIVFEPKLYDSSNGRWGVRPNDTRSSLTFTGDGDVNASLPIYSWAVSFRENMPKEILEAVKAARSASAGSIQDDGYRKRLQDKFGSRWSETILVQTPAGHKGPTTPGVLTDELAITPRGGRGQGQMSGNKNGNKNGQGKPRGTKKPSAKRLDTDANGTTQGVLTTRRVDVPRWEFQAAENFPHPWIIVLYDPDTLDGETVFINKDSSVLEKQVQYYQEQYPEDVADEVREIVLNTYGEIACAKVAHQQVLLRESGISKEEFNATYRSPEALSASLMGLMAEDAVVSPRLGKLGRKKEESK